MKGAIRTKGIAGETVILQRITACSNEKSNPLTYTHKLFYLLLLRYALKHGEQQDDGSLRVCVSEKFMSETFSIAPRMITKSLKILSENGILLRRNNKVKGFQRKPSETILLPKFFMRGEP